MIIIDSIKKQMGSISFDAKFKGMRKAQDFIVYPISSKDAEVISIQSDNRFGEINIKTGVVTMSNQREYANSAWLSMTGKIVHTLKQEERQALYTKIAETSSAFAGNEVLSFDNSGAGELLKSL